MVCVDKATMDGIFARWHEEARQYERADEAPTRPGVAGAVATIVQSAVGICVAEALRRCAADLGALSTSDLGADDYAHLYETVNAHDAAVSTGGTASEVTRNAVIRAAQALVYARGRASRSFQNPPSLEHAKAAEPGTVQPTLSDAPFAPGSGTRRRTSADLQTLLELGDFPDLGVGHEDGATCTDCQWLRGVIADLELTLARWQEFHRTAESRP